MPLELTDFMWGSSTETGGTVPAVLPVTEVRGLELWPVAGEAEYPLRHPGTGGVQQEVLTAVEFRVLQTSLPCVEVV